MKETPKDSAHLPNFEILKIDGRTIYKCTVENCSKEFKFKSKALRHVVVHDQVRQYKCYFSGCDKAFKRNDALINHLKLHELREISNPNSTYIFLPSGIFPSHTVPKSSPTPQDINISSHNDSNLENNQEEPFYDFEEQSNMKYSADDTGFNKIQGEQSIIIEMAKSENRILKEKLKQNEALIKSMLAGNLAISHKSFDTYDY